MKIISVTFEASDSEPFSIYLTEDLMNSMIDESTFLNKEWSDAKTGNKSTFSEKIREALKLKTPTTTAGA